MISFRDVGAMRGSRRIVGFTRGYGMRAVSSPRPALLDGHACVLCRDRAGGCSVMSQSYTTQHR